MARAFFIVREFSIFYETLDNIPDSGYTNCMKRSKKPNECTDAELAAYLKSLKIERQATFSQFIILRSLNPGIDAKDYFAIYDAVTPAPLPIVDDGKAPPAATHIDTLYGFSCSITRGDYGTYKMVWYSEDGEVIMNGSNPESMPPDPARFMPIE